MAKLPTTKRILIEKFPDKEQKWLGELLEPLNKFMEDMERALNNQLTIRENMDGEIKTVVLDGTFPVKFKPLRRNKPLAVLIGQCREVSENHVVLNSAISLDWEVSADGMIQVNDVVGLTVSPANKYNLTLVLLSG